MVIPSSYELHLQILQFLKNGEIRTLKETIHEMIVQNPQITKEEINEFTTVGKRRKIDTRVSWGVSQLRHAKLLHAVKKGSFKISLAGLDVLKDPPEIINQDYLITNFPEYREWIKQSNEDKKIEKKIPPIDKHLKHGVVMFLDALGIKGIWKRTRDGELIMDRWTVLKTRLKDFLENHLDNHIVTTHVSSFSDTIIVAMESNDTDYVLKKLGLATWRSIVESMESELPIRGCFAVGEFRRRKDLLIGKPVDEAAQYYGLPQWIGISAAPSANLALEKIAKEDESIVHTYRQITIPLKNTIEQNAWAVNWPELLDEDNDNMNSELDNPRMDGIISIIEKNLSGLENVDESLKWRNTGIFLNTYLDRFKDN